MKRMQRIYKALRWQNWPFLASVALVLVAASTYLASRTLSENTLALEQENQQPTVAAGVTESVSEEVVLTASLPDNGNYTKDLASFFKIANDSGLELGAIDYKLLETPRLPALESRSMDFRLNDEYPKVKGFLSRVLQKLPHASLQEIRIEKRDVANAQAAVLIRIILLYQVTSKASEAANGS